MSDVKCRMLQEIPIFGSLSEDTLFFLLSRSLEIPRKKGELFFKEGEAGQSLYVLESGRAVVLKYWNNSQYVIGELSMGDCFGEMAIMDIQPRSASVMAIEDSLAFEINAASIIELCQQDLSQFTIFQMNLGREISRRLRSADERLFHYQLFRDGIEQNTGFKKVSDSYPIQLNQ